MELNSITINSAAEAENFYNSLFSNFIDCYYPFYISSRDPVTGKADKWPMIKKGLTKDELISQSKAKLYTDAAKVSDFKWVSFGGLFNENYMMVDIDDMNMAEHALNIVKKLNTQCAVILTFKGMHFIFKKPTDFDCKAVSNIHLVSGLKADYKFGFTDACTGKKKIMWEVLKENGSCRKLLWVPDNVNNIETLPFWLEPIKYNKAIAYDPDKTDIYIAKEGDRNTSLWSWVCRLKAANRQYSEIRRIAGFINDYIFDSPLEQSELDVMLSNEHLDSFVVTAHGSTYEKKGNVRTYDNERPWEYVKNDSENTKIDIDVLVQEFFKRFRCIIKDGAKYIYNENEGIYDLITSSKDGALYKAISSFAGLLGTQWERVLNKIFGSWDLFAVPYKAKDTGEYMFFNNCIVEFYKVDDVNYHYRTKEFTPDIFSDKKMEEVWTDEMSWGYVKAPRFEKFMQDITCGNVDDMMLLYELAASCMMPKTDGKVFFLEGNGANGKSTFVDAVQNVIGSDKISSSPLSMLTSEHGLESIVGKMANICSDENGDFIRNVGLLKQIATGDKLQINPKGCKMYSYIPYSTLVFCCNTMPIIKDNSQGMARRSVRIKFKANFMGREDYSLSNYLKSDEATSYFAMNAVLARCKFLSRNRQFTLSAETKEAINEFADDMRDDNHYWFEHGGKDGQPLTAEDIKGKTAKTMVEEYCLFSGIPSETFDYRKRRVFIKDIRNEFNLELKKVPHYGQDKVFWNKEINF